MADITLSPIPYNGGTISNGPYQNATCMLSSGVFLHVVVQSNPAYVFAYVTTMTNMRPNSGTYSTVASPMRAILSPGSTPVAPTTVTGLRVFKLNQTTAALVLDGTMYVLQVGAGNDVTLRSGTSLALGLPTTAPVYSTSTPALWATSGVDYAGGSAWQFFYARDNVLYGVIRNAAATSENTAFFWKRIAYNPTTGALGMTSLNQTIVYDPTRNTNQVTGTAPAARCAGRAHCMEIPGSTTKLLTYRTNLNNTGGAQSSFSNAFVYSAYLVTNADSFTLLPNPPANVRMMVPLATNRILGFVDSRSYYVYNGTSWGTTPVVFSANGTTSPSTGSNVMLYEGAAIDSNYFVIWSLTLNTSIDPNFGSSPGQVSTRIGRYVDSGLGQVSTATATNEGLNMPTWTYPIWDQQPLVRDGTDAFFWFTRDSASPARAAIKVQYQAGG